MSNTQAEREMLEAAAKAMGRYGPHCSYVERVIDWDSPHRNGSALQISDSSADTWNPATDDGDCARMEAALGIGVSWKFQDCVYAEIEGAEDAWSWVYFKDHNGDKQAARRMASLRVAAEIGRSMK